VLLRVKDVHPAPCSIYAAVWGGQSGDLIATGANDGGVGVLRLVRGSEGKLEADGPAAVTRAHNGAVRGVAFASSATLVTAGADAAPRVWDVGQGGRPVVTRTLAPHETPVVGVVADWVGLALLSRYFAVKHQLMTASIVDDSQYS
jgi:hypothetical protein